MVRQTVRDFAHKNILPQLMEWDESQTFPIHIFKALGELGLMGVLVPEKYNGSGLTYFEYVAAIEELSKVCGSIGLSMAAHNSLCTGHILAFANDEQKQRWLPKLATAEWIGAWDLLKPIQVPMHCVCNVLPKKTEIIGFLAVQKLDHSWHYRRCCGGFGKNR